jgi:hypothetical protein
LKHKRPNPCPSRGNSFLKKLKDQAASGIQKEGLKTIAVPKRNTHFILKKLNFILKL